MTPKKQNTESTPIYLGAVLAIPGQALPTYAAEQANDRGIGGIGAAPPTPPVPAVPSRYPSSANTPIEAPRPWWPERRNTNRGNATNGATRTGLHQRPTSAR